MSNIFEQASEKIKNSSIVLWVFLASVAMLLIGINHFWEDTYSTYMGMHQIAKTFDVIVASYETTYWTMAISFQVGTVVFTYLFLVNTQTRWPLGAGLFCFGVDFFFDAWYRSNEMLFSSPSHFIAAVLLTFTFFTVGSELFVTVGLGMVLTLFAPAISQFRKLVSEIMDAIIRVDKEWKNFNDKGGGMKSRNDPFRGRDDE